MKKAFEPIQPVNFIVMSVIKRRTQHMFAKCVTSYCLEIRLCITRGRRKCDENADHVDVYIVKFAERADCRVH